MSMLTIVIPTKNEESNIQNLLEDLNKQDGIDTMNIIIADANSKDATRHVATTMSKIYDNLHITIIDGGLPGIARNKGAELATTEYVLFMDADIRIPDTNLISNIMEFATKNNFWMVTTNTYSSSTNILSSLLYWFSSKIQILSKYAWYPFATGMFMFTKKSVFEYLGGFDSRVDFAEDFFLSKQIPNKRFGVYTKSAIYTPDRRLRRFGSIKMIGLMIKTVINTNNDKFFYEDHKYWK